MTFTPSATSGDATLRWPRDPKDPIEPGLAKEWEWSDGGKSDAALTRNEVVRRHPFTTADITFWWENIELDTNIIQYLMPNGSLRENPCK